jgi:hypothetical protein
LLSSQGCVQIKYVMRKYFLLQFIIQPDLTFDGV